MNSYQQVVAHIERFNQISKAVEQAQTEATQENFNCLKELSEQDNIKPDYHIPEDLISSLTNEEGLEALRLFDMDRLTGNIVFTIMKDNQSGIELGARLSKFPNCTLTPVINNLIEMLKHHISSNEIYLRQTIPLFQEWATSIKTEQSFSDSYEAYEALISSYEIVLASKNRINKITGALSNLRELPASVILNK